MSFSFLLLVILEMMMYVMMYVNISAVLLGLALAIFVLHYSFHYLKLLKPLNKVMHHDLYVALRSLLLAK